MRVADGREDAYDVKAIYLTTADGTRWMIKDDGDGLIVRDASVDGHDAMYVEPRVANEIRVSTKLDQQRRGLRFSERGGE